MNLNQLRTSLLGKKTKPKLLEPFTLKHYKLLLQWIILQPSQLDHYIEEANADLRFNSKLIDDLLDIWHSQTHKILFFMHLVSTTILAIIVTFIVSLIQNTIFDWPRWLLGFILGFFPLGLLYFVISRESRGITLSMYGGILGGCLLGAELGLVKLAFLSLLAGSLLQRALKPEENFRRYASKFIRSRSPQTSIIMLIIIGTTILAIASSLALAFIQGRSPQEDITNVVYVEGVPIIVQSNPNNTVFLLPSTVLENQNIDGLQLSEFETESFNSSNLSLENIMGNYYLWLVIILLLIAGYTRLFLYIPEWIWTQFRFHKGVGLDSYSHLEHHPVSWDELVYWPLPRTKYLLEENLKIDLLIGIEFAICIAINARQRRMVQNILTKFLNTHNDPLHVIYQITYLSTWRRLFLLDAIGSQAYKIPFLESLLARKRIVKKNDLFVFCHFAHYFIVHEARLENELERINRPWISLSDQTLANLESLKKYKNGFEVANSFVTLAQLLTINNMEEFAHSYQKLGWIKSVNNIPLRPVVMETLKALGDVSRDGFTFIQATSVAQKAAALNRAAGALNELSAHVKKQVLPPERIFFLHVVDLWKLGVAIEQGKLGEAKLREMSPKARLAAGIELRESDIWLRPIIPFDNPYVVGDPVYPPLFVGRSDIFNRISEVWSGKKNPDSIILYGHRRMGKSSILRNLDQVAPLGCLIVYVDLAGETSFIESTADFLRDLAYKIYSTVHRSYIDAEIIQPNPDLYATTSQALFQFNHLLEQVRDILDNNTLILAFDEFEALERAVITGIIGQEIYQFLRTKTQEPWLTIIFGGLHTLDEMSRDYQQPFFSSYENIRVTYLTHKDAWHLITNPSEDFGLNYEFDAVECIIHETGGQPYLIQRLCRDAIDHLNHELFDLEQDRVVQITLADVETILNEDFFRRGIVYFDGVWNQMEDETQRTILRIISQHSEPWSFDEVKSATGVDDSHLRQTLRWAERHDILKKSDADPPTWQFCVPLMRRWINQRK